CTAGAADGASIVVAGNRGAADAGDLVTWFEDASTSSSEPPALLAGNTWAPTAGSPGAPGGTEPSSLADASGALVLFDALCSADVSLRSGAEPPGWGGVHDSAFQDGCASRWVHTGGSFNAIENWWGSGDGPSGTTVDGSKHDATADAPWVYGLDANPDPADLVSRPVGSPATIHLTPEVLFSEDGASVSEATYVSTLRQTVVDAVRTQFGADADTATAVGAYLRLGYRVTGANPADDPLTGWLPVAGDDSITLSGACPGTDTVEVALLVGSPYEPVPLGPPASFSLTWTGSACAGSGGGTRAGTAGPSSGAGSLHGFVPPGGGTLTSTDGALRVGFPDAPAGGYSATVVTSAGGAPGPAPGTGRILVGGLVYEIEVVGSDGELVHDFGPPFGPLSLTFEFATSSLPPGSAPEDLSFWFWDETLAVWVPVPTTVTVDAESGLVRLTAEVDHLTTFAVFTGGAPIPPDVLGHWAQDDVLRLVALGVVSGYTDGTFRPDGALSRAEFARILASALGLPLPEEEAAFAELGAAFADAAAIPVWARPYVAAVAQAGYLAGYPAPGGGLAFEAGATVTRDQAAVALARVLEREGRAPDGGGPSFSPTRTRSRTGRAKG
ncbi:MAG: S-layer homology domain-containing protein, partial [Clostridia bacterium]|nr:S-layer homology domain-containing protein [Clostridia bacterium]